MNTSLILSVVWFIIFILNLTNKIKQSNYKVLYGIATLIISMNCLIDYLKYTVFHVSILPT